MTGVIVQQLNFIETSEGTLYPIYRDWDTWHEGHFPKMVYATSILPGVRKDIILHKRRTSLITAISGDVMLRYKLSEQSDVNCVWLRNEHTQRVHVVKIAAGIPIELTNSSTSIAVVINAPTPSWHPDDPDTVKFKTWEEYDEYVTRNTP